MAASAARGDGPRTVPPGQRVGRSGSVDEMRSRTAASARSVPEAEVEQMLSELSEINPYFAVGTGVLEEPGWRPLRQLYRDPQLLTDVIDRVAERIAAPDRLVAVSTFYLGFAARLFSIGLGAVAGYGVLPDLAPEQLWYRASHGSVRLHLPNPTGRTGGELASRLLPTVYDTHLLPLAVAARRLGPISEKLLCGNAASALLGAARVFDRHHGGGVGPAWRLGRMLCADERLATAVSFTEDGTDYRRNSCCLYYRTPGSRLCIDCALPGKPRPRNTRGRNWHD